LQVDGVAPFDKKGQAGHPWQLDSNSPATPDDPDNHQDVQNVAVAVWAVSLASQDNSTVAILELQTQQHLQKNIKRMLSFKLTQMKTSCV
jgi:hypothetical protein